MSHFLVQFSSRHFTLVLDCTLPWEIYFYCLFCLFRLRNEILCIPDEIKSPCNLCSSYFSPSFNLSCNYGNGEQETIWHNIYLWRNADFRCFNLSLFLAVSSFPVSLRKSFDGVLFETEHAGSDYVDYENESNWFVCRAYLWEVLKKGFSKLFLVFK